MLGENGDCVLARGWVFFDMNMLWAKPFLNVTVLLGGDYN